MPKKPLILLSNDDGYEAGGLHQLIEMVRPLGELVVVAPDGPRSGAAMAFTGTTPISARRIHSEEGLTIYSCTGTPCDCVKLAFARLLPRRPDLVLSGINYGDNAAVNSHYSGTMAVAVEGTLKGVASVAFSSQKCNHDADFSALRDTVVQITKAVLTNGLPGHVCLNVNYPDAETFRGMKLCRMDRGDWVNEIEERIDPRQRTYYWVAGNYESHETPDNGQTDYWAINNGYVAITPTTVDRTAYDAMDRIAESIMPHQS